MTERDVVLYPDRRLKQVCAPALGMSGVEELADALIATMQRYRGCVGIAAPQIGELVRVVVVDVSGHPRAKSNHGLTVLIDPVVEQASDKQVKMREGCLSIPDLTGNVIRPENIVVSYFDVAGERRQMQVDAFEARVVLHELDHLDGVLFLDRVRSAKDVFARKQYQ